MKSGFWHFPARLLGAVLLVVAVSGIAMAGASSLTVDSGSGIDSLAASPMVIENVFPPDGGDAVIGADRLSFVLTLPPMAGGSFNGAFNVRNGTEGDIIVDVTAGNPDSLLIDFIDPFYGVSGQSGSQHWRLYLVGDSVSTIQYLVTGVAPVNPGFHDILVTLALEPTNFGFVGVPDGQKMWGGDGPSPPVPPAVIPHIWPMFRYNPAHTGRSDHASPLPKAIDTFFAGGVFNFSSAAISANGTIYIGALDNRIYALNSDGSFKWGFSTGDDVYSSPAIGPDGTVYIGSDDGSLYAMNPDGSPKWSYPTGGVVDGSPAIGPDGTVYIGSRDGAMYALNPDGTLKWSYPTGGGIFSTPAVAPGGTIYFGSFDWNLYALKPDGTFLWSYPTGGEVYSSPALAPDGTIYFGSNDGNLYALNPDGTFKWSYPTGGPIFSSPGLAADGTVYIGSFDASLYAINPDGTFQWSYPTGAPVFASPVLDANGNIFFGSWDNNVYALFPDGSFKWSEAFPPLLGVYASGAIAADGTVVYVTTGGVPGPGG